MNLLGDNVATVQQTCCHIFAIAGIAFHHLVVWLEASTRDLRNGVGLVGCLRSRDNGCVCNKREVDAGIRHQVRLEFIEIDIEGAIKSEGGGDR